LVLSIAKDLAATKEMQRPARIYAKAHSDLYHVREVNGQEEVEPQPPSYQVASSLPSAADTAPLLAAGRGASS